MTDGCPSCGSAVQTLHGMPGYVACSNPDCNRYNVGWDPEENGGGN